MADLPFPRRGCVYWVRIPDEPRSKRRPAIVVSADVRNRLANDVIVVPVSTTLRPAPTHVTLRAGEGGLPDPSVAKCEQITTILKDRLQQPAIDGPLSTSRMREIERAILRALSVPIDG